MFNLYLDVVGYSHDQEWLLETWTSLASPCQYWSMAREKPSPVSVVEQNEALHSTSRKIRTIDVMFITITTTTTTTHRLAQKLTEKNIDEGCIKETYYSEKDEGVCDREICSDNEKNGTSCLLADSASYVRLWELYLNTKEVGSGMRTQQVSKIVAEDRQKGLVNPFILLLSVSLCKEISARFAVDFSLESKSGVLCNIWEDRLLGAGDNGIGQVEKVNAGINVNATSTLTNRCLQGSTW